MKTEHEIIWASCCKDPEAYRKSLEDRIKENYKGGIKAKLRHRGDKFHKLLGRMKNEERYRKI